MADSRRNVPGWVPVMLVTAVLVAVIWVLAGPTLVDIAELVIG